MAPPTYYLPESLPGQPSPAESRPAPSASAAPHGIRDHSNADHGTLTKVTAIEMASPSATGARVHTLSLPSPSQGRRVDSAHGAGNKILVLPDPQTADPPAFDRKRDVIEVALTGLCGADLYSRSAARSSAPSAHPLLAEDPSHIRFNLFPMIVMGGAWACQIPLLVYPGHAYWIMSVSLAYALSLIIGCVVVTYNYPAWTMEQYFGNPLDAIMRLNTHSNSLANADDSFARNESVPWDVEKTNLACRLQVKAKQKLIRRQQIQLEHVVSKLHSEEASLLSKQHRLQRARNTKDYRAVTAQLARVRCELDARERHLRAVTLERDCESEALFADYKLVPTYFSYFFLIGFVILSVLIAVSNNTYQRAVVLPCLYKDDVRSFNVSMSNGTDLDSGAQSVSLVFDASSLSFRTVNLTESVLADHSGCLVVQAVRFSWLLFWSLVLLVELTLAWHLTTAQSTVMRDSEREMRLVVDPTLMAQIVDFIKAQHWDRQTLATDPVRQMAAIALALAAPLVQLVVMPQLMQQADWFGVALYLMLLPVGCVAGYTVQYLMYGLSIIYWRNRQYMLMCSRVMERFNVVRTAALLMSWWHVRELFRRVLMPVGYSLGAWGLTSLLLLTVSSVLIVVVVIFVAPQGVRIFLADPTLMLFVVLAIIALIILFRILTHAVSVYAEQQRHIEVMQRAIVRNQDDIAMRIRAHFEPQQHADEKERGDTDDGDEHDDVEQVPMLGADTGARATVTRVETRFAPAATAAAAAADLDASCMSAPPSATRQSSQALPALLSASEIHSRLDASCPGTGFFATMHYIYLLSRGSLWPEIARASQAAKSSKIEPDTRVDSTVGCKTPAEPATPSVCGFDLARSSSGLPVSAVSSWQLDRQRLQLAHARRLRQLEAVDARLHSGSSSGTAAAGAGGATWDSTSQREMVASFCTLIRDSDTFPAVLGIPIKPTLLQLVSGYVASALLLVVGKFVAQMGF